MHKTIITVALAPCWDVICRVEGLEWGDHKVVDQRVDSPAGKALNISRALSWMGQKNTAAGLWGKDDFERFTQAMRPWWKFIDLKMTPAAGRARENITILDTVNDRELHLRNRSTLASKDSLSQLKSNLKKIIRKDSVCVFAGALPGEELLAELVELLQICRENGAELFVDTSGEGLKQVVEAGGLGLISPNIAELSELTGSEVADDVRSLSAAGKGLLERSEIVLISRAEKGAVAVTRKGVWQGRCVQRKKALHTVGCGDYLLAGFLYGLKRSGRADIALSTAIKAAGAKAWGLSETHSWKQVNESVAVKVQRLC